MIDEILRRAPNEDGYIEDEDMKYAKSQLLAEILKGKETFEIPEYEQGILEAIPTQYLKELFNEKEK